MTALQLLSAHRISVVKGNYGEMMSLMGEENAVKGVDSLNVAVERVSELLKEFSMIHNTISVATGEIDLFSDGKDIYFLRNGTEKLGSITASGCMLGSVIASFMAVQKDMLLAALEGAAVYSIAGELASDSRGVGSFRTTLLDSLSTITPEDVMDRINLEKL
jgi:hydroxyethylthiazole kinase